MSKPWLVLVPLLSLGLVACPQKSDDDDDDGDGDGGGSGGWDLGTDTGSKGDGGDSGGDGGTGDGGTSDGGTGDGGAGDGGADGGAGDGGADGGAGDGGADGGAGDGGADGGAGDGGFDGGAGDGGFDGGGADGGSGDGGGSGDEVGLRVNLTWDHAGDDLDLHLVRPGGTWETDDDCYYANCAEGMVLDWGRLDITEDDPHLVLDDIPGYGPEETVLEIPENGDFVIYVHDYPGSVYAGVNVATVTVYHDGVAEYEISFDVTDEDTYYAAATVTYNRGALVGVSAGD